MSEKKFNIAVLIDGDNAQATLIKKIIAEVSKYGKATIRRIYVSLDIVIMKVEKNIQRITDYHIVLHFYAPQIF